MRKAELQGGRQEPRVLSEHAIVKQLPVRVRVTMVEMKRRSPERRMTVALHSDRDCLEWQGHSAGRTSASPVSHKAAPRNSVPIQDKGAEGQMPVGKHSGVMRV